MFIILSLLLVAAAFAIGGILGAPYVPILRRDSRPLLKLAGLKPGQTLIDLGCGDGRLLRSAAQNGIHGIGYEINPILVIVAKLVCWRYRRLVTIRLANFWQAKLPPADAIYVFLMPERMSRLDQKLQAEITRPTLVISYIFALPNRQANEVVANSYLYIFTPTPHRLDKPVSTL